MARSNEWIGGRKEQVDNFFIGSSEDSYDPQEGIVPETLGEKFTAGSVAGGYGMEANINYLDAAWQALTGDEYEKQRALTRARISEEFAAEAMEDLPLWEEFVNEPTAAGFFEQAAIGFGQFLPSAFASITAATIMGGLAALTSVSAPVVGSAAFATGIVGKQIFSKAGLKAAKNIFKDAMEKKSKKLQMSQAQWDLNEGVYSTAKRMFIGRPGAGRAARFGGYAGAGGQEYIMGAGITFGEFARQDMTGPREALISGAVGVPYAMVGLGSEALALRFVFGPLMKEASKRAVRAPLSAGYRNLMGDLSKIGIKGAAKGLAIGGGAGLLAEGGAEAIQDTMTGLQRLAIDPTYDTAQMKMDIMEATFKGAVGGFGLSGAGRAVTQSARDMISQVNVLKEKQTDLFGPDAELEQKQRDLIKARNAIKILQQDLGSIKIPGTDLKTTGAAPEVAVPALDLETIATELDAEIHELEEKFLDSVHNTSESRELLYRIDGLKRMTRRLRQPGIKDKGKVFNQAAVDEFLAAVKADMQLEDELDRQRHKRKGKKVTKAELAAIRKRVSDSSKRVKTAYANLLIEEQGTGETVMTFPDLETRQLDFMDMVPDFDAPLQESIREILAQFAAVLDPDNDKDSVWIPENHNHPSPTELDIIFGDKERYVASILGRGTIYSINSGKVNYVVNNKADDEVLAQVLGMDEAKNASHDRGILVKNKEGRTIHSESTSAHREKAAIEKQKERFNTTEKGKATYIVDEQARHLEDIALERRDALMEEAESGEHITRAIDELANAKSEEAVARMIKRFETNYPVLKALHDSVKNKKDASSVRATKALHDMLLPLLMDTYKTYSEELGEDIDPKILIALTDIAEAAKNLQPKPKTKGISPTERATREIEMREEAAAARELGVVAEEAREQVEEIGSIADAGDFNIIGEMDESQFNQVTVIGKLGTINQEAEPWQVARPRGDETQQIAGLSQEILAIMTEDEAATFAANQIMMGGTPFSFPIGLLNAYKEIRAAQPNAILKIRPRYITKISRDLTKPSLAYTPFNILEFFNKNPNLAIAAGLKYQELGFVIETTASPEEVLIEYDDKGSKIKGKLTVDQYFKRLVVEARRSLPEFKEKSGWTLVSPDGKSEKVDIASMIRGARAIINAEKNYVPGDLKSVYQALISLFAVADRNGYDFKLGNKSLLKNEFTPKQLLNSKAKVYVSGPRVYTFGELLEYNLHNKTQYGDMLGQSAKLVEVIQDKTNLNIEEILSRVNGPEGKNYPDFAKLNEEEAENATAIVPETSETMRGREAKNVFELAKEERDPKKAAKLRLKAKTIQRTINLFAFKDILDGLYQIAIDNGVNVGSYELGYMGVDKETLGTEEKLEPGSEESIEMVKSRMISDAQAAGMEVSDWYDIPAIDMAGNSKYSYVTEYKGRQYSSSGKTNHTLRSKNRKINITQSEAFKKHLGTVNDQFNAVLRKFKYFGVSNDIHFMTFEDFVNPYSKPSKAQKILNEWYGEEMAKKLTQAYWHRRKNTPDGEGLTVRATNSSPWIVVIDTGPLLDAKTKKKFAVPTDIPIKSEKKAKGKAWSRYNKKESTVYLDESELRKRFKNKAWTKPTVKGVKALPEGQFKTVEQWRNFVTRHEFAHAKYPQQEGESKATYENRINQLALAVDERGEDIITETAAIGKVSTALAHELAGHVIIMDILNSVHFKPWRDRLYKEYQKSVDKGYKFSFDEWVSDQAGIQLFHYATHGKFKPATNAVDSFFRRIAKQVLDIWTSIVDGIGRRRMNLADPNETFGEFWQEVMRLSKEGYAFERAEGKLNHMEQKQVYDMVEQTAKPFNLPPSIWQQISNKVTEVVQDLQSPGGIGRQTAKLLFSAEGFARREEFGRAGEAAANYFYHKTATITKEGEGLTYPQQTTKDFTMLSNKFGETIEIDERGSVFLGVDETATMALDLYSNDTITDQQLLDTKKYGEAGKLAHDIRVKFMREYVFFGYLMQKGKEGQPVLPKMKLLESYMIPGDESTRVSFAHREWWLEKIRNEDAVRQGVLDIMIRKIINRELLGKTKDGKNYVIGPKNRKSTKDMAVEEFAQAWAETKISNILKLPHDNTLAESIIAEMEETDTENVDIGFPAALARTFLVQYLPDLDGTLDEDGNPVIKMYGIQNQELKEVGALVGDQMAMINYLRTATKKFAFEDRGGRAYLESLVESLPEHLQPHLRGAIRAQLGKLPAPLDPWFKRINSYGLFVNIVTTLTFAALASFPDLAGPLLRSREMAPFSTAGKEYMNYFQNKQEAVKFAMDLGIVSQDTLATMYINAAEMDYMTLGTKKGTDLFFRMIMLEQFTKFSRVFAANMGRAFILNLAHDTTKEPAVVKRWLRDLGLTKEEVLIWEKTKTVEGEKVQYDFTTPEGKKVSDAIYRFVDESIIRPNAAQRPTWASNPYFALVWQLKGFFYAYGKTIMGGQGREIMNRYNEAGLTPAMLPIAMMALTILPLTALGLELREAIKYGMGGVLPGVSADPSVFRSDDMSVGTYSYEMLDRSGMGGPYGLLFPILSGREYGGPFEQGASLLGPTANKVTDMFKYGPFDSRFLKNQIPLYYTLPSEE